MDSSIKSKDRREEILDHAFDIVRESGLASLTMKKIAMRIGFAEPAAYRYFPNKQALLLGMVDKLGETLLAPIRRISASFGTTEDRLERIVRHHVDFVLQLDGLPILLMTGRCGSALTAALSMSHLHVRALQVMLPVSLWIIPDCWIILSILLIWMTSGGL